MTDVKQTAKDWLVTLLTALILALIIRTFIVEANVIPSDSMVPTLQVGDRLLTEKITYRFNGFHRGDIIVFQAPPQSGLNANLIKRIVGVSGDTIQVENGTLLRNGQAVDEPYIKEKIRGTFGPYTVPPNTLFVMGDNRNNSFDSRYWGPVPLDLVIGKAAFRFFPFSHMGLLTSAAQ